MYNISYPYCLKLAAIITWFCIGFSPQNLSASSFNNNFQIPDSTRVNEMVASAIAEIDKGSLDTSLEKAQEARELSEKISYKSGQVRANVVIGSIYRVKRDYAQALDYYLKANQIALTLNDDELLFYIYRETASLYQDWNVIEKAIDNYLLALPISKKLNDVSYIKTLQIVAFLYQQQGDIESSMEYYNMLADIFRENNSSVGLTSTLSKMSSVYLKQQDYSKALELNLEILRLKEVEGDENSISKQLNEIGFIQRQLNRDGEALKYFEQALRLQKKLNKPPLDNTSLLINMAVINQRQRNFDTAISLYKEAQNTFEKENKKNDVAKMHIYLAATYYGINDLTNSRKHAEDAVKLATETNNSELLEKGYSRLSSIYEKQGNAKKSLEVYKNYIKVREQVFDEEKNKLNQVTANQLDAEKQEKRLKLLMVDQQLKDVELEKLAVEKQRQEQELAILKQQQDLQEANLKSEQLEKERVASALRLAEEELLSEKRTQEIAALQKEQQIQDLALRQKELEEQEQSKTIKLLESETELLTKERELDRIKAQEQEQRLQEEKKLRLYGMGLIGLIAAVLILIIVGYIGKQKANAKLANQNIEITEQKKEIEATAAKLELANKAVEAQKEELEFKNIRLTDSIVYAKRIQNAILPIPENINKVFADHFSIFMPKDMVSGDFYWFTEVENKIFFAVVDCTGHGVPGAFMSMIGNTLLNQIVKEQGLSEPHQILEALHYNIRDSLKQRNSENVDGMDVGIFCLERWEDGVISLKFSGAKIPLILLHNHELHYIKGDRKSIGGWQKDKTHEFTPHSLQIDEGDIIYFTTDGVIDIANQYRKRLGSQRLKDFLFENHSLPFDEQKERLSKLIKNYQKGADQRDDITFIGLKV